MNQMDTITEAINVHEVHDFVTGRKLWHLFNRENLWELQNIMIIFKNLSSVREITIARL